MIKVTKKLLFTFGPDYLVTVCCDSDGEKSEHQFTSPGDLRTGINHLAKLYLDKIYKSTFSDVYVYMPESIPPQKTTVKLVVSFCL